MLESGWRLGGLVRGVAAALFVLLTVSPVPTGAEETAPLSFGTFTVGAAAVVDGDTIRIEGQPSVRVMGIDTEETFRNDADRASAAADFDAYAAAKRGKTLRPVKYGTPLGETAKAFALKLLGASSKIRLERDRVEGRELDIYGRRLAHVIIVRPDGDVNFAVEMVRAGLSPYFVKYGRSLRFDRAFRDAEAEARRTKCGLWSAEGPHHYPDYPERLEWWHERADQVTRWRQAGEAADRVMLGTQQTEKALRSRVGKETTVFGTLWRAIDTKDGTKKILFLADRKGQSFSLVFFDKQLLDGLDMPRLESMYITARGQISLYRDRPQMVIERAEQISTD